MHPAVSPRPAGPSCARRRASRACSRDCSSSAPPRSASARSCSACSRSCSAGRSRCRRSSPARSCTRRHRTRRAARRPRGRRARRCGGHRPPADRPGRSPADRRRPALRRVHDPVRGVADVRHLADRARRQRLRRPVLDEHPLDDCRAGHARPGCAGASTPSRWFISASNQLRAFESGLAASLVGTIPAVSGSGDHDAHRAQLGARFPAFAVVDRLEEVPPRPPRRLSCPPRRRAISRLRSAARHDLRLRPSRPLSDRARGVGGRSGLQQGGYPSNSGSSAASSIRQIGLRASLQQDRPSFDWTFTRRDLANVLGRLDARARPRWPPDHDRTNGGHHLGHSIYWFGTWDHRSHTAARRLERAG